jgi:peptide/nickel transport system permease protein
MKFRHRASSHAENPFKRPFISSEWRYFWRVFLSRRVVMIGLVIFVIMLVVSTAAPWLVPFDPNKQDLANVLLQPGKAHLLGTDQFGRDSLSRLIYGARTAMIVGIGCVTIACLTGATLGAIGGYFGGIANVLVMRFIDVLMAFPMLLLAILIAALLGGGLQNVIIALSIVTIPPYARVMAGQTLSIKENDYIIAMKAAGARKSRILFRHILPNAFPALLVQITTQLGTLILNEASLSFIGIGIKAPAAAWGSMLNDGYKYLLTNPILSIAPGVAIMLVVFAFNMVGDGLRDALDPRLRGKI